MRCKEATAIALVHAIERLLLDHEFAQSLATGAGEYVREHHQMSTMAAQTMEVFQRVALKGRTFKMPDETRTRDA